MEKKGKRDTVRAAKIILTAKSRGVTKRQVERVLTSDRKNEHILLTYFHIDEGFEKLMQEAARIVPL